MPNSITIYYFSGTGNAKRVASWVAEYANANNHEAKVYDISKRDECDINVSNDNIIGFVSPTHGFNFPPIMLNFLFRFPRAKNKNNVFIINTRAGMKLSKLFLPGLSGLAQIMAATVLWMKGYKIVGMRSIDLPSNWISLHPGLSDKVIDSIFGRCKRISQQFIEKILNGKKVYRALYDLPQDIIIAPISVLYYCIGRFIIAKTFIASTQCDNCGLCIKQCPVKAISLVNNRPFWSYKCESCMKCMNNCPRRAIETAHGFIFAVLFVINVFILSALYQLLGEHISHFINNEAIINSAIRFIFEALLSILIVVISYRLVHYIRRFKFFEYLVIYTSLTKYKFWRRYKAPKKA